MKKYDAIIVGGGPAGSTCARQLIQANKKVLVLDKSNFPRDKVCAGWITPAVVTELGLDLAEYHQRFVLQPIHGFRVGLIHGTAVEVRYDAVVSYGIRRCEFDHYLLSRAGTEILTGKKTDHLEFRGGTWYVDDHFETPLLIGAGGHFCPVAKHLGADFGQSEAIIAAQEIEFKLEPGELEQYPIRGEIPELYFCRDLQGYGWCFRKGNYLNIGLGRQDNHKLTTHVQEFVEFLQQAGRIPRALGQRFLGHAYLLYGHQQRPLVAHGALLIGDAAGLAYPQSGEGIRPAIESAILAARTILAAKGDYGQDQLQTYVHQLQRRFGVSRQTQTALAAGRTQMLQQRIAHFLLTQSWFIRYWVVGRWFLQRQQPALIY